MKNYYQYLGIEANASKEQIKKAYRLYASKFHPDKHSGDNFFEEKFKEVNTAYETLYNDNSRSLYDSKLKKFSFSFLNEAIYRKREEELHKKEKFLETKEKVLQKKFDQLKKLRKKEHEKWKEEKLNLKRKKFDEREKTIYLKKGNVLINGNACKIGNSRYELNEIYTFNIQNISKRKYRVIGWVMLITGLFTIYTFLGFLIFAISFIFLLKKDKITIIIRLKDNTLYYISSNKKLAFVMQENIEKAISIGKEKYPF